METEVLEEDYTAGYIAFIVRKFSDKHRIPLTQAFNYLYDHGGIHFLYENYGVEHCENPRITLDSLQFVCKRNGGEL
jgi:hypothetical protein